MVGEQNEKHNKKLGYFAILQENLSYKENLFILYEFATPHICLTAVTENL